MDDEVGAIVPVEVGATVPVSEMHKRLVALMVIVAVKKLELLVRNCYILYINERSSLQNIYKSAH